MKATPVLLASFLLATALAGCAGGSDDPSSSSSSTSQTGTSTGTSTGTGTGTNTATSTATSTSTGPTNQPPTVKLSAANTKGTAPLTVNFTVTASDPEKAPLTYTLVFGDKTADAKGAVSATPIKHVYAAVGNYSAKVTVTDGVTSANATVTIRVSELPVVPATEYSCTTIVGAVVVSGNNVGGCSLVESTTGPGTIVTSEPAAGCNIQVDLDGDGFADEEISPGAAYAAGVSITAFCDPTMTPNSESKMSIRYTS